MTRVSPGTILVGVFAVLFGLVGAYAIRQELMKKPAEPVAVAPAPRPVFVPVASVDLEPGRELNLSDIAMVQVLPEELEARGYTGPYMRNSEQIVGRILRAPVTKGATFFTEMLYPEGVGPSIAERVQPGFRAVTIAIASDDAVAGLATPGSLVDVIFRAQANEEDQTPETTITLLEGVEVLAIGRTSTPGAQTADETRPGRDVTVTLAVAPKQANALRVVQGRGELSLAMRNPHDVVAATDGSPQTLDSLLGLPRPKSFSTEIFRGSTRNTVTFVEPTTPVIRLEQFPVRSDANKPTSLQDPQSPAPAAPADASTNKAAAASEIRILAPVSQRRTTPGQGGVKLGLSGLPLVSQN
jgi:pilus assembly protein CpaB